MTDASVLTATLVRLRPPQEADLPLYVRWFNDPEVRYWLYASDREPETLESQRQRFEDHLGDKTWHEWVMECEGQPIGFLGLVHIEDKHGLAELYVCIGEKEVWGRGIGTEAIRRVVRYGFEDLGLRRVELTTDADNARGRRCFEKAGFVHEGTMRAQRLRLGIPTDRVIMSALREDARE